MSRQVSIVNRVFSIDFIRYYTDEEEKEILNSGCPLMKLDNDDAEITYYLYKGEFYIKSLFVKSKEKQ